MSYASNNAVVGANNRSKRAEIPFTIVNGGTNTSTITIDDPYAGVAECVNGGSGTDSSTGVLTLDTSAVFTGLGKQTSPPALGFVVLDGATELQQSNLPLPGNAQNPSYGTPVARGTATRLRSAKLVFTDGSAVIASGSVMPAARAALGSAGVTANGNLQVKIPFTLFSAVGASNAAPVLVTGSATTRGVLELVWD